MTPDVLPIILPLVWAAILALAVFLYVLLVAFLFVKILGADVIGDSAPKKKKKKPDTTAKTGEVAGLEMMGGAH